MAHCNKRRFFVEPYPYAYYNAPYKDDVYSLLKGSILKKDNDLTAFEVFYTSKKEKIMKLNQIEDEATCPYINF